MAKVIVHHIHHLKKLINWEKIKGSLAPSDGAPHAP
jgi:hypothetical protein